MAEFTTILETSLLPGDNRFNHEDGTDGERVKTLTDFKRDLTECRNVYMVIIGHFLPVA